MLGCGVSEDGDREIWRKMCVAAASARMQNNNEARWDSSWEPGGVMVTYRWTAGRRESVGRADGAW